MLVLRRKNGEWIEVTHRSGEVLRFRVYDICSDGSGRVNLAFDDPDRHFTIQRPERLIRGPHFAVPAGPIGRGPNFAVTAGSSVRGPHFRVPAEPNGNR